MSKSSQMQRLTRAQTAHRFLRCICVSVAVFDIRFESSSLFDGAARDSRLYTRSHYQWQRIFGLMLKAHVAIHFGRFSRKTRSFVRSKRLGIIRSSAAQLNVRKAETAAFLTCSANDHHVSRAFRSVHTFHEIKHVQ